MPDPQTNGQSQSQADAKSDGKTGTPHVFQKPLYVAAIDAHMHIQSGHCGPLPFAVYRLLPIGLRKNLWDVPGQIAFGVLKRSYLDNYLGKVYGDAIKPSLAQVSALSEEVARKIQHGAEATREFQEDVEREMLKTAQSICRMLEQFAGVQKNIIDEEYWLVISAVSETISQMNNLADTNAQGLAFAGATMQTTAGVAHQIRTSADIKSAKITHAILALAAFIVEILMSGMAELCSTGAAFILTLKDLLDEAVRQVVGILETICQVNKISTRWIWKAVIAIFLSSSKEVSRVVSTPISNAAQLQDAASKTASAISNIALDVSVGLLSFLDVQRKPTPEIANLAISGNNKSIVPICEAAGARKENTFCPIMAMPMDLDYAHLDRFDPDDSKAKIYRFAKIRYRWLPPPSSENPGQPILLPPECSPVDIEAYRKSGTLIEENGKFYYFHSRISGKKNGILIWLDPEETDLFKDYNSQVEDTITAATNNPWRVISLYHFEPRRYKGDCNEAFQYIMSKNTTASIAQTPRLFIGIKLYPNLGYKPQDIRLPSLATMYDKCLAEDIPILAHTSPQGAFTHDRPLYLEHDNPLLTDPTLEGLSLIKGTTNRALFYFMQRYSSPQAWEPVLQAHQKLRLCLAHFGGSDQRPGSKQPLSGWEKPIDSNGSDWDQNVWNQKIISLMQTYPNLYTDLACMDASTFQENMGKAIIKWPDLRKRIMFGTDWYMTEMSNLSYSQFCLQLKAGIDAVNAEVRASGQVPGDDPSLWQWFTEINPFRFYRFDRIVKPYTQALIQKIGSDGNNNSDDLKILANYRSLVIQKIAKRLKAMGELPDN
jgi:predicted TIM-barrel fold metal-dependent hydrolase